MKRRVVITGMGAVTPIGNDIKSFWNSIKEGKCGIDEITHYDTANQKVKLAAEVKDLDISLHIPKGDMKKQDKFTQFAVIAATEAINQSGIVIDENNAERCGVIISSGIGGIGTIYNEQVRGTQKGFDRVSPFFIPMSISNMASGNVAIKYGL